MIGIVKKTINVIIVLFAILLLVACNNQYAYYSEAEAYTLTEDIETELDQLCPYCGAHYVSGLQRQQTPPINIHEIFASWQEADIDFSQEEHDAVIAELDGGFHCPHTIIYAKLEGVWPITIALWTDRSLRYMPFEKLGLFTNLSICCDDWCRWTYDAREVPLTIDELFPNNIAILCDACSFISHGAIIFTDAQGIQRRIIMSESWGNYWPLYHLESHILYHGESHNCVHGGRVHGVPAPFQGEVMFEDVNEDDMAKYPDAPRIVLIETGSWVSFRFNAPVSDVAFVGVFACCFDDIYRVTLFELQEILYKAGDLSAGQPVFVQTHTHMGTMPRQAIGFTYTNGIRYYIPFSDSQEDGSLWLFKQAAFTING